MNWKNYVPLNSCIAEATASARAESFGCFPLCHLGRDAAAWEERRNSGTAVELEGLCIGCASGWLYRHICAVCFHLCVNVLLNPQTHRNPLNCEVLNLYSGNAEMYLGHALYLFYAEHCWRWVSFLDRVLVWACLSILMLSFSTLLQCVCALNYLGIFFFFFLVFWRKIGSAKELLGGRLLYKPARRLWTECFSALSILTKLTHWPVNVYWLCSFPSDTALIMSWIYREMNHVVEEVYIHAKKT